MDCLICKKEDDCSISHSNHWIRTLINLEFNFFFFNLNFLNVWLNVERIWWKGASELLGMIHCFLTSQYFGVLWIDRTYRAPHNETTITIRQGDIFRLTGILRGGIWWGNSFITLQQCGTLVFFICKPEWTIKPSSDWCSRRHNALVRPL